jgi:uncharacterized protein (DUF305 family)
MVVGILAIACGGNAGARTEPTPQRQDASAADFEALYQARTDSARMRFTEADVKFFTGMISHHAQALVMSGLAPTHGAGPAVSTLASRIINAQNDEIHLMQQWLRDRGQPVPEVHVEGLSMMIHGAGGMMNMPGMLTQEQMQELDRSRGPSFDRLFLTYMIQHHTGALTMVRDLFASDGAGNDELAFKLASDIQADQTTEIARMKGMLSAISGEGGLP